MSTLPLDAMHAGYLALGLDAGDPVYLGEQPGGTAGNGTVICLVPAKPDRDVPVERLAVRITVIHAEQQEAYRRAWDAYRALHRRAQWALEDWLAMWCEAHETPHTEPAVDGQGTRCYRMTFLLELAMKDA